MTVALILTVSYKHKRFAKSIKLKFNFINFNFIFLLGMSEGKVTGKRPVSVWP